MMQHITSPLTKQLAGKTIRQIIILSPAYIFHSLIPSGSLTIYSIQASFYTSPVCLTYQTHGPVYY